MESLQISKEQCEKAIELMKRIKTLQNNQDFKKVIEECYLKEEPVRLTMLLADPSITMNKDGETVTKDIINMLKGIGSFNNFIEGSIRFGEMAQKQLMLIEEHERENYKNTVVDITEVGE